MLVSYPSVDTGMRAACRDKGGPTTDERNNDKVVGVFCGCYLSRGGSWEARSDVPLLLPSEHSALSSLSFHSEDAAVDARRKASDSKCCCFHFFFSVLHDREMQ